MTTAERRERWCGALDPSAFARWVADRSAGCGAHLVPVVRVGRCPDGHLAAEVLRPAVRPLGEALDVLGAPTEGVAVTLTVPLLQVAVRARAGAVEVGTVPQDGVGVDESGAVLVADVPPGAVPIHADGACAADLPRQDTCATGPRSDRTCTEPGRQPVRAPLRDDPDGPRQLVLAARMVWDRVDARAPARRALDPVLDAAKDGDAALVAEALDLVTAAAPPRPVRWTRPVSDLFDGRPAGLPPRDPAPGDVGVLLVRSVRDVVERGIPLGAARRLPLRHAVVGVVLAGGLATAATSVL
ncbi:hypothetical protein [Curtobacterium sp. MCSS17_008]|uniref:hypothetical protein n=1 Tax=Curtobacterium sp. MCSS17_008 TaxID=2175647 RepID=UPI0011B829AE|nr:hypothetical protein [Curtobacterium sp. MCSS17_008]